MSVLDPGEPSLLLSVLEELPMGVGVARVPGCDWVYANRGLLETMGAASLDQLRRQGGGGLYRLLDRTGRPYPKEDLPIPRVARERCPVTVDDMVLERADQSRINLRARGKPLFDARGTIAHVMVAFDDITAEVIAAAEGAAARERLRTAVAHAPIILFLTDREGTVTLSEGAALQAMGFRPGELVGRSVYDLYRDNPEVLDNTRRVMSGETFTSTLSLGEVTLNSWLAPLRDASGEICGSIGVCTDVTERLRLQRQVAQADRLSAIGRLAASVAHEINNPLAYTVEALRLATDLAGALPDAAATGPLRRFLADASEGAERVRIIAGDLKTFSRGGEEARRPVDLNQTLEAAIKLVAKRTGTRATVDRQLGPTVTVRADENRLVQIFVNLVLNAADALPAERAGENRIRISTRLDGGEVVVEVADNGPGVAPAERQRIFEPFVTSKPVGEGTGLGLFVTRTLVSALGGAISVAEAPEGGALFSVRLPVDQQVAPSVKPSAGAESRPPGRWRVLIIDDDPQVLRLLQLSLQREYRECDVRGYGSGRAALDDLVAGEPYDLVFCDLMMGELSGIKIYEELRRRAPGREREMIFMTGGVFDNAVGDFLASIPNDCLDKPFDIRAEVRRRLAARPA